MDNYPYSLTDTIESLEYALSYNEKNTMAICLMGRIYAEQLMDYETAKDYFSEALSYNIHALEVYPHYIQTLILNEDFAEAEKLIDFAMTVKGMDKVTILLKKVWMKEVLRDFKMAKEILKEIKLMNCHDGNNLILEEFHKRINSKIEKKKRKKSK